MIRLKFMIVVLGVLLCGAVSSCKDEDKPEVDGWPCISNVFPDIDKVISPRELCEGWKNNNGQLTELLASDASVEFYYNISYKGYTGRMHVDVPSIFYINYLVKEKINADIFFKLNGSGFISDALIFKDKEVIECHIGYNATGNIAEIRFDGAYRGAMSLYYEDGNFTIVTVDNDSQRREYELYYTSDEYPSGIVNDNNFMDLNFMFDMEMYGLEYAYSAGMLGKAPDRLPLGATVSGSEETAVDFMWSCWYRGVDFNKCLKGSGDQKNRSHVREYEFIRFFN